MDKRYGILIVSVTILVLCFVGTASATTWSVDGSGGADFTGIQEAINNASDGDTIIVHSGVYYENVVVDKSVTVRGIGHPVVDANGSGSAITLNADGITLVGFNATNSESMWSDVGIKVTSNNNSIIGNNVCNNWEGIYLYGFSSKNTITGNTVSNNYPEGIYSSGSDNLIYLNNFINNTDNVHSSTYYESTNIWNSTEEITYYNGKYTNYLGNYWDDYTGSDKNNDGIGDTPYNIDGDKDYYPLMERYENYV